MRRTCLAGLVAAVAVLGACGSSGGTKSSNASSPSGAAPTTASSSGSSGGGNSASFCNEGRSAAHAATSSAANPLTDTNALQQQLNRLKQTAADAPAAIRSDVNTLLDYYTKFVQAAQNAHGNPQAFVSAIQGLQANQASITAAAQRVTAWVTKYC